MSSLCHYLYLYLTAQAEEHHTKTPSWLPKLRFPFPACLAAPEFYLNFSFVYLFLSTATPFFDSIHYHIVQWRWPHLVQSCCATFPLQLPFLFLPLFHTNHSVTCRKRKPRKSRPDPNTTPDLSCAHPTAYLSFNTSSILLNGKLLFFCQRNISRHDGNTFTSHLPQTK